MRKYRFGLGVFVLAMLAASMALASSAAGQAREPCPAGVEGFGHPGCRTVSMDESGFQVPQVVGSANLFVWFLGEVSPNLFVEVYRNDEFQGGGWGAFGLGLTFIAGESTVLLRNVTTGDVIDTLVVRVRPA